MRKYYSLAITFLALASCRQLPQHTPELTVNKFSDTNLQKIYTVQDERKTQELQPYLHHNKPAYRTQAALAFASVQDTVAIPDLLGLLSDTTTAVRKAAAYALGQVGHRKAEDGLIKHMPHEGKPEIQATLLEAIGKVAGPAGADYLANYNATSEVALAGQAWGLYRAGLRQQYTPKGVELAVKFLSAVRPYEARLAAAHFLARAPKLDLTAYRQPLLTAATSDAAPEVRMAVTQALGKVKTMDKAQFLSNIAQSDPDYRVRLSAVRAMSGLEFRQIKPAILSALQDKNINTAVAASEFIQANPAGVEIDTLLQMLPQVQDARVRSGMIWVMLRNSQPHNRALLNNRYKQQYQNAKNPYDKAYLLKALSGDVENYKFISEQMFAAEQPIIATTGMEAIITMRQQGDFPRRLEADFAEVFKKAVGSGDVALVGMAAAAIRDPKFNLRSHYKDNSFLTVAQQKLQLPRDMETNIELQRTIDYLNGKRESITPENPFTHPIDWALVKTIPDGQQVLLRTDKGTIVLQLFIEDAPGSVANFVELIEKRFFDNLYFHRVVPNFVAQGGDKRGDGWGSSDYSIRSEFAPLHYREGYLGMASAGKDTESNQWFITHSPAPHLDGKYTIFAKVIDGMEVVHQLEVGDKILEVSLK
ncbi:peptidylprolyl isomerase [uncultured Pontibacter sp.]|uniref:peptidylprolyl isomerase n=1 Tax=uncultured Pontibacter sp. TaxID=453356 RepID=UPI00260A7787|nr:peptidylprolyl isomerase [uncultured Pontibacter sp.]